MKNTNELDVVEFNSIGHENCLWYACDRQDDVSGKYVSDKEYRSLEKRASLLDERVRELEEKEKERKVIVKKAASMLYKMSKLLFEGTIEEIGAVRSCASSKEVKDILKMYEGVING